MKKSRSRRSRHRGKGQRETRRTRAVRKSKKDVREAQAEVLTKVDAEHTDNAKEPRIRASWRRYFQACVSLLERGIPPTLTNIAKELRVSKQTVWALQRRHPELLAWINDEFIGRNRTLFGPLQFRLGQLGIQGSVQAAALYLHSLTMGFGNGESAATLPAGLTVIQNYLVPRPEYPKLPEPTKSAAPVMLADIPTVAVR
jgi:hypothetical protein